MADIYFNSAIALHTLFLHYSPIASVSRQGDFCAENWSSKSQAFAQIDAFRAFKRSRDAERERERVRAMSRRFAVHGRERALALQVPIKLRRISKLSRSNVMCDAM